MLMCSLEKELACILTAEAAAASTGKMPIAITPEVADFS